MAFRGWDLEELWQDRRWRFLLNLVNRLPRNTHFVEAMADDEESIRAWLATNPEESEPVIRLSEWSPEREVLASVLDAINASVSAIVASAGGKPGQTSPSLRPVTKVDEVRESLRRDKHYDLVRAVGAG